MCKCMSVLWFGFARLQVQTMKEGRAFPHPARSSMKARLLLGATIVATAVAARASAQMVRPESLSYMSRLFRLNDVSRLENPQYSRDGRWLAFDARSNDGRGQHIFLSLIHISEPTRLLSISYALFCL